MASSFKKFGLFLFIMFFIHLGASGSSLVRTASAVSWSGIGSKPEITIGDSGYATFSRAVATLNATGTECTIVVPNTVNEKISSKLTINSNIDVKMLKGANLSISIPVEGITAISKATHAQITTSSAHKLSVGDLVLFSNISGSDFTKLNNNLFKVGKVIGSTNFTIDFDSSAYSGSFRWGSWSPVLEFKGSFEAGNYRCFSFTDNFFQTVAFTGPIDKVNISWFGAVPDGRTDSYRAIQKAYFSLNYQGGTLIFPAATLPYMTSYAIEVCPRTGTIATYGYGACLKIALPVKANRSMFELGTNFEGNNAFYGLECNGNRSAYLATQDTFYICGFSGGTGTVKRHNVFKDLYIHSFGCHGMYGPGNYAIIENCRFNDNHQNAIDNGGGQPGCQYLRIINNTFTDCGALAFDGNGDCSGTIFSGNYIHGWNKKVSEGYTAGGSAVTLDTSQTGYPDTASGQVVCANNVIEHVDYGYQYGDSAIEVRSKYFTIHDNIIRGNNSGAGWLQAGITISYDYGKNGSIHDNQILNAANGINGPNMGMNKSPHVNVNIHNNIIETNTIPGNHAYYGIITNSTSRFNINHNIINMSVAGYGMALKSLDQSIIMSNIVNINVDGDNLNCCGYYFDNLTNTKVSDNKAKLAINSGRAGNYVGLS